MSDRKRSHAGWVIVYKNDPHYKGCDRYVVRRPDGTWSNTCHDLYDCHKFITPDEALLVLKEMPQIGEGWLPGAVHRVDNEVRVVLCGENFKDLNDLLHKLRTARPLVDPRNQPTDAVGVDVPDGQDVRGKASVRRDGGHAGPVPKLGQIIRGFLGGSAGFRGFA